MKNKMIALVLCSFMALLPISANATSATSDVAPCFIFDDLIEIY